MGPKKWPKQVAFILFRQRKNKFVRDNRTKKETNVGHSINENSKQSLGLG